MVSLLQDRVALLRSVRAQGHAFACGAVGRRTTDEPRDADTLLRMSGALEFRANAADLAPITIDGRLPRDGSLAVLLVAVVGSRAHGLAEDDSDVDRRGVYVPAARVQFSLEGAPPQLVHDDDQLCIWEVGKFVRLALAANPTVLEMLYSSIVEFVSPAIAAPMDALIRSGAFLSRRCYQTFLGYADAQFLKMERSRAVGTTIKWQHAMHLVRLLEAGIGLLRTATLDLRVADDRRETLRAIKRGELDWTELVRLRAALVEEFVDAMSTTSLPESPDIAAAERFLVDLRMAVAAEELRRTSHGGRT